MKVWTNVSIRLTFVSYFLPQFITSYPASLGGGGPISEAVWRGPGEATGSFVPLVIESASAAMLESCRWRHCWDKLQWTRPFVLWLFGLAVCRNFGKFVLLSLLFTAWIFGHIVLDALEMLYLPLSRSEKSDAASGYNAPSSEPAPVFGAVGLPMTTLQSVPRLNLHASKERENPFFGTGENWCNSPEDPVKTQSSSNSAAHG